MRALLLHGLRGSKHFLYLYCYALKYYQANFVVLLGDTVSPAIVRGFRDLCGAVVLGVLGKYDNAAVASALNESGGLLECRSVDLGGFALYGVSLSGCINLKPRKVDVVVAPIPGLKYGCCIPGSSAVDNVVEVLKPRVVITGSCKSPCERGPVFSPGNATLGYLGVLDLQGEQLKTWATNIHSLLYKLFNGS